MAFQRPKKESIQGSKFSELFPHDRPPQLPQAASPKNAFLKNPNKNRLSPMSNPTTMRLEQPGDLEKPGKPCTAGSELSSVAIHLPILTNVCGGIFHACETQ
jgi:hypothetical protein